MTQPKLAHATEWGRMYGRFVGDRPRVPSITTVLGEAPDTLHGWHARVAAAAMKAYLDGGDALAQYPHVTAAINQARNRSRDVDRAARKAITGTGVWLADQASERGDRVHDYAEQVARYYLGVGTRDEVAEARDRLAAHDELGYAAQFDNWWRRYDVQPVFAEATVWHHEVAYAGTIDIGFETNELLIIGDYKSKDSFDGRPKRLDPKVGLQLVAAMNAQEYCTDPQEPGVWEPWRWGSPAMLVGIAISDAGVDVQRINPNLHDLAWTKFQRLRALWQSHHDLDMAAVLSPLRPPPSAALWPDEELVPLDLSLAAV
ncbi:hypothetical protein O4328_39495 [Rhodococcus opacus]|uniref:Cytochrome n=1 Tax=Rhodococcus opacus TaxID=37919 RepID=A0AAX3YSQ3_RHOOP|nr:hypothetical protein [Rhodococcus opacus]MCZ4589657.1 hypothetical protein [Rhodococcus opacus]WLF51184.1 hypothetical protein Q5707_38125 [Rhodococcus opacus]